MTSTTNPQQIINLSIHGDNIVECERAWALIKDAFNCHSSTPSIIPDSIIAPNFEASSQEYNIQLRAVFLPGFNRWSPDILAHIKNRGAMLREAADAIICLNLTSKDNQPIQIPLLAIEFCGALAAGNQAWQRCGRALAFSAAKIPYIYLAELGGFELDEDRNIKAVRLPNPLIPFAYLTLSFQSDTFALPVFIPNAAADKTALTNFHNCFGLPNLLELIRHAILNTNPSSSANALTAKTLALVNILSDNRKQKVKNTFTPPLWEEWLKTIHNDQTAATYIAQQALSWGKTAYIAGLTQTTKNVINSAPKYAIGAGASQVPICVVPASQRVNFANFIITQYPKLTPQFRNWLKEDRPLGICWVMGFKPRGDDARPDRGLPPLARMIFGPKTDLLTFVYGPAKPFSWPLLHNKPQQLANQNGLWEAILAMSDAILVDSITDKNITDKGYLRSHWHKAQSPIPPSPLPVSVITPTSLGENDVDTVIHLLMTSNKEIVFEGMCNPPGGDWSGISIKDSANNVTLEKRWLSLPRVSAQQHKRPDHVFQIFFPNKLPIILSVESKEKSSDVEPNIGERLSGYIQQLMKVPSSVEREFPKGAWKVSVDKIDLKKFRFASAVAFLSDSNNELEIAKKKSQADLIIGITISANGKDAELKLLAGSPIGTELLTSIHSLTKISRLPIKASII